MIEFKTPTSADEVVGRFVMTEGKMRFKGYAGARFVDGPAGASSLKCRSLAIEDGERLMFLGVDEDPNTVETSTLRLNLVRVVCDTAEELNKVWEASRKSMQTYQAGLKALEAECQGYFDAIEGASFDDPGAEAKSPNL